MALHFDATTELVNHGSTPSLDQTAISACSYLIWLKPNGSIGTKDRFFEKAPGNYIRVETQWGDSSIVAAYYQRSDGSDGRESVTGTLTQDEWQCFMLAYDPTANPRWHIYRGTLATELAEVSYSWTEPLKTGTHDDSAGSLYVGNAAGGDNFQGDIALFAYWKGVVLTLGEGIAQQYSLEPNVHTDPSELRLFVNLGFNGVNAQPDWSGNGNVGTVTGATVSNHVPLAVHKRRVWVVAAAGGQTVQFSATCAGATTTPSVSLAVARQMSATLSGASSTPAVSLGVSRLLAAAMAGASTTPSVSLAVSRAMVAQMAGATATPSASLAVQRPLAATMAAGTATPSISLVVVRALSAVMSGQTVTPDDVVLTVGAVIEFAAICAGQTLTPQVALSVARAMAASMDGITATASASLSVSRDLAAAMAGATATPSISLTVTRALAAVLSGVTVTPDDVILTIAGEIVFAAVMAGVTATSTPSLVIERPMAATMAGSTVTPSPSLAVERALSAAMGASSATPDDVALAVERALSATLGAATLTPSVALAVTRALTAALSGVTVTPDNVVLLTALVQGLMRVLFSGKAPSATTGGRTPGATYTGRRPTVTISGKAE